MHHSRVEPRREDAWWREEQCKSCRSCGFLKSMWYFKTARGAKNYVRHCCLCKSFECLQLIHEKNAKQKLHKHSTRTETTKNRRTAKVKNRGGLTATFNTGKEKREWERKTERPKDGKTARQHDKRQKSRKKDRQQEREKGRKTERKTERTENRKKEKKETINKERNT